MKITEMVKLNRNINGCLAAQQIDLHNIAKKPYRRSTFLAQLLSSLACPIWTSAMYSLKRVKRPRGILYCYLIVTARECTSSSTSWECLLFSIRLEEIFRYHMTKSWNQRKFMTQWEPIWTSLSSLKMILMISFGAHQSQKGLDCGKSLNLTTDAQQKEWTAYLKISTWLQSGRKRSSMTCPLLLWSWPL